MSVLIYSTPTCSWCRKTKDYFAEKKVEYTEIDVSKDQSKVEEMFNKSGQMGVPVLDINGTIIVGYDKEAIDRELGLAP